MFTRQCKISVPFNVPEVTLTLIDNNIFTYS